MTRRRKKKDLPEHGPPDEVLPEQVIPEVSLPEDEAPEHDLTEEDLPEERLTEEVAPEDGPNSRVPILVGLRKWIIGALVLAIIGGLYWRLRSPTHVLGEAYVADQSVTLWSTLAQVRQRAGEAHWGDHVEILQHSGAETLVRTSVGIEGWMDGHALIDSAAWQREVKLQSTAHAIPIQATGHTKVFTNVRLDPGRDATRIYQLPGGVALAIVGRATAEVPPLLAAPGAAQQAPGKDAGPKREDWLLVYPLTARPAAASATVGPQASPGASPGATPPSGQSSGPPASSIQGDIVMGRDPAQRQSGAAGAQTIPPLAGWVLARYVGLDLPETLRDYATSAGMRPVAWFVLNYVSDDAGAKPQYLMAGNRGAGFGGSNGVTGHDGPGETPGGKDIQSCDFNSLRVYTWGAARHRYETAFVESNLCGYFPIRASKQPRTGDPEFRFTALESVGAKSGSAKLERVYAMHQTTVRRNKEAESAKSPAPAKSPKRH